MYFIFLKRKITWTNWFIWIGKYIINLFTKSKLHHVASSFYSEGKIHIGEAKMTGYRITEAKEWRKKEGSHNKIYAYRVIQPHNPACLVDFHKRRAGTQFDFKGAVNAVVEIFDEDKDKEFCSETQVLLCQHFGWLSSSIDADTISPIEFLNLLKDNRVINPKPEIWR